MTSARDRETQDVAFERLLLESAHDDGPSPGSTDRAWDEFAARVAATVVVTGAAPDAAALAREARRSMLKWLGIGLAGGSALSALLLHSGEMPTRPDPGTTQTPPVAPPRVEPRSVQSLSEAPVAALSASTGRRAEHATPSQRAASVARKVHPRPLAAPLVETSLLSQEIAALDAARAAIAASDASSAIRIVEGYRREFPNGQLTADAHALEIEALHARGDGEGARRRFARFRARYPNDPQAARLEQLLQH